MNCPEIIATKGMRTRWWSGLSLEMRCEVALHPDAVVDRQSAFRLSSPANEKSQALMSLAEEAWRGWFLDRRLSALVGADAHDFLEWKHEHLAVTDLSRLGRLRDGVDGFAGHIVAHGDL